MNSVRLIQVIETRERTGCGQTYCKKDHPHEAVRLLTCFYSPEGKLLAWDDPMAPHVYYDSQPCPGCGNTGRNQHYADCPKLGQGK